LLNISEKLHSNKTFQENLRPATLCRNLIILDLLLILFSPALSNLIEIIIFSLFLFSLKLRRKFLDNYNQPLFRASILFIIIIICSSFWSIAPINTALQELWGWRKILLLPISLALFQKIEDKERAINALLFFSIFACFLSYLSISEIFLSEKAGIMLRHHAFQGMVFSIIVIIFVKKLLFSYAALNYKKKIIYTFFSIIFAINVLVGIGRSGYLILAVMMVMLFINYLRESKYEHKKKISIFVLCLVSISLILSTQVRERIALGIDEIKSAYYLENDGNTSMGLRANTILKTSQVIKENMLFGVGNGGFETAIRNLNQTEDQRKIIFHDPHNQYLKIWAEFGLIGLSSFIYLLISAFKQKKMANEYSYYKYNFKLLGLIVLIGWIFTSIFSSHFSTFSEGRFIYLWIGIMLAFKEE